MGHRVRLVVGLWALAEAVVFMLGNHVQAYEDSLSRLAMDRYRMTMELSEYCAAAGAASASSSAQARKNARRMNAVAPPGNLAYSARPHVRALGTFAATLWRARAQAAGGTDRPPDTVDGTAR